MNQEALKVMNERFGKDTVIVLGTSNGAYPAIRYVNAYYENGAFMSLHMPCPIKCSR